MFGSKPKFARIVAAFMHAGQEDLAGEEYFKHVSRVAASVEKHYPNDEVAIISAWLHDTVEDTPLTLKSIRSEFGDEVAETVKLLSRNHSEGTDQYYKGITTNVHALRVKIEDINDNFNPARLDQLPAATRTRLETKYMKALDTLSEYWGGNGA